MSNKYEVPHSHSHTQTPSNSTTSSESSNNEPTIPLPPSPLNFFGDLRNHHSLCDSGTDPKCEPSLLAGVKHAGTSTVLQCDTRKEGGSCSSPKFNIHSPTHLRRNADDNRHLQPLPMDEHFPPATPEHSFSLTSLLPHANLGTTSLLPLTPYLESRYSTHTFLPLPPTDTRGFTCMDSTRPISECSTQFVYGSGECYAQSRK